MRRALVIADLEQDPLETFCNVGVGPSVHRLA